MPNILQIKENLQAGCLAIDTIRYLFKNPLVKVIYIFIFQEFTVLVFTREKRIIGFDNIIETLWSVVEKII